MRMPGVMDSMTLHGVAQSSRRTDSFITGSVETSVPLIFLTVKE